MYSGRLAILAGGLGGLGSSTAKLLRSKGAHVALLYAPFEASRRTSALSKAFGSDSPDGVSTYECDITSESSVASAFEQIAKTAADLNVFPSILVNAAGYVSVQPLVDTSAEEAMKNIVPNLMGPFIVSKAFHKLYTTTNSPTGTSEGASASDGGSSSASGTKPPGRIVSISSQASHVALNGHSAYCASKAGLNALTRCMALEWGPEGITANTVSPTVVLTELGKKAWADDEKREKMLAQIPSGRFAEPEEVAHAIEFLCSDSSGLVQGSDVRIDGGFTIR